MGRPRTPIGTFGVIATSAQPSGSHVAKTRYRDWDGKSRLVQATGSSRSAAERKLKQKLSERSLYQPGFNGMSADSPFPELVAYWLEDMEIEDRLSRTTRNLYERDMRSLVLPAFKELTLREIGVEYLLEDESVYGTTLTSFRVPQGKTYEALHAHLKNDGFVIYAGQGKFDGAIFRIAVMGEIAERDLDRLVASLRVALG